MAVNTKFNDRKKTNPLYQKLSDLNREVKELKEEEIREKLRGLKLNDRWISSYNNSAFFLAHQLQTFFSLYNC